MKHESDWVDVNDDALMVKLGIRHPNVAPRDPSVWTKSPKEKVLLKKLRNHKSGLLAKGGSFEKYEPLFKYTLCVTIAKNGKFTQFDKKLKRRVFKTTFSHKCYKKEIPFILNKYVNEEGKSLVKSYSVRA